MAITNKSGIPNLTSLSKIVFVWKTKNPIKNAPMPENKNIAAYKVMVIK